MIYLFHGPGKLGMLNRISQIRKNFEGEIREISGKAAWNEIKLELQTTDLFSDKRLVIVEDPTEIDLTSLPDDLILILKFSKTLASNSVLLKNLPKGVVVESFPEEKETSIFPLLDFLSEKNPKALLELESHLDEWGGQYVITMLFYMLRRFILPAKNLPPFVLRKMEVQRKNFSLEKIKYFYKEILETDFKIKQGLIEEKIGLYLLAEKFLA